MSTATITSKGQVTIPKPVRDALGLGSGDQIVFVVEGDGVRLRPVRGGGLAALRGTVRGPAAFSGRSDERAAAHDEAARNALGRAMERPDELPRNGQ